MTAVPPQLLKNFEPVPVPELEVEDDAVIFVDERKHPGLFTRRSGVDGVRFIAQHTRDELQYRLIIIDYENPHPVLVEVCLPETTTMTVS